MSIRTMDASTAFILSGVLLPTSWSLASSIIFGVLPPTSYLNRLTAISFDVTMMVSMFLTSLLIHFVNSAALR